MSEKPTKLMSNEAGKSKEQKENLPLCGKENLRYVLKISSSLLSQHKDLLKEARPGERRKELFT